MNVSDRAGDRSIAPESPHGMALLRDPLLNKGTAFTAQERDALGLRGLLPAHVLSMQAQAERVMTNLRSLPNDLEKYVALNALHDRNEALFFHGRALALSKYLVRVPQHDVYARNHQDGQQGRRGEAK